MLLFTVNLHAIEKYNVILNGTIENIRSDKLTINEHSTEIDTHGNFRFELSVNESNYYYLKYIEKIRIFLSPNDSLHITLDSNNIFETLKFSGRGSNVNNFLVEQAIIEEQIINDFKKNFKSINSLQEKEFVKRIDSLRSKFDEPIKHWNTARLNVALKTFTDEKMKNHWLHQILKNQIHRFGIKNNDYLMATFREHCSNDEFVTEIEKMYDSDLENRTDHMIKIYKNINNFNLDAHIFFLPEFDKNNKCPCLISFDRMCPFWTAKLFTEKMKDAGNRCDFFPLKGANHIFYFIKKYH